jgi:hypothetical protein
MSRPRRLTASARTTRFREVAVPALLEDPNLSLAALARLLGLTPQGLRWWLRDTELRALYDQARARGRALRDPTSVPPFREFRKLYLSSWEEMPLTGKRVNVGETLPFQAPFVDLLGDDSAKRVLCLMSVRSGKSTILEHFIVWMLCRDPNTEILVVCQSRELARDRLWRVKRILEDRETFPELHARYGPFVPEVGSGRWSEDAITLAARSARGRDPNVRAIGVKSKIHGARADIILLDDVDTPATSPVERRKILRQVGATIRTRLNEGGRVVMVGNRAAREDIYTHFAEIPGWHVIISPIVDPQTGRSRAPELYDDRELEALAADLSREEYALMVLLDPEAVPGRVFSDSLIRASRVPDLEPLAGGTTLCALDPSVSGFAAAAAASLDPESGRIRLLDLALCESPGFDGLFDLVIQMLRAHAPKIFRIEAQGGTALFATQPLVERTIREAGCRLDVFRTGANKHSISEGIMLIADWMRRGLLEIPTDERFSRLIDDLVEYENVVFRPFKGGYHYDALMATWMVVNLAVSVYRGHYGAPGSSRLEIPDPLARRRPYLLKRPPAIIAGRGHAI